jgi:hypothetical protein
LGLFFLQAFLVLVIERNFANRYHSTNVPLQAAIAADGTLLRAKCAAASILAMNGSYVEAKALVADAARAPRKGPGAPAETETVWRDVAACMLVALQARPPPSPPSRTKWTRLVHPSVLIGHVFVALQIETCEWDKVRA